MYSHLPNQYWNQFKDYIISIVTSDGVKETATLVNFYQKLADKNNAENIKYNIRLPEENAKSLFLKFIERPSIKILDEQYILKYMVMRIITFFYYDYFERPCAVNPLVVILDSDANILHSIMPDMWRWWVKEMEY